MGSRLALKRCLQEQFGAKSIRRLRSPESGFRTIALFA